MPFLRHHRADRVVTLTMASPGTRNALSASAVSELVAAIEAVGADASASALVLASDGPTFCAGGDVKEMLALLEGPPPEPSAFRASFEAGIQRLARALHALPVPAIAAVDGPATGAGLDLACLCDLRIASRRAVFAESFIRLGLVPGDGGAWLLTRLVGPMHASRLAFTGEAIDAAEALRIGLVTELVEDGDALARAQAVAASIAGHSGTAIRLAKGLLRAAATQTFDESLGAAADAQTHAVRSGEHRAALAALADAASRRRPS